MWIVRDLLTAMNRTLVDSSLWKKYLRSGMDLNPGHSSIVEIMSHCDLQTVRAALMQWIHDLWRRRPLRSGMQRDLGLLAEKAEGISFLHSVHYSSRQYSPLFVAMQTSQSFTKIRELLQNSSHFEIVQMVREDIRLCSNGWTEDTLMAVFNEEVELCTGPREFACKTCGRWLDNLYSLVEYPWGMRLRRLKLGIPQDLPLDKTEIRGEKLWDEVVASYQAKICLRCQKRVPYCGDAATLDEEHSENDSDEEYSESDSDE